MFTTFISRLLTGILLICIGVHVMAATSALPLISGIGNYKGHLNYKDYTTGKHVKIPMRFSVNQSSDRKKLIIDKVFIDPGYEVHSLSVLQIDFANNLVFETTFDKNESQKQSYEIVSLDYSSPEQWKLVRRTIKQDNNQDALVVISEEVNGSSYTSETRVDYMATTENEDLKRNWVEAALVKPSN